MKKTLIILVVILTIGFYFYINKIKTMEFTENYKLEQTDNIMYSTFKGDKIKYDRNGIKMLENDKENKEKWMHSYFLNNPALIKNDNYFIITQNKGHNAYIFNENGLVYDIKTENPIVKIKISDNGYLGVLTEENNKYNIIVFNDKGEGLIKRTVYTFIDSYPIDFDISDDGKVLSVVSINFYGVNIKSIVSYFYIDSEEAINYKNNLFASYDLKGFFVKTNFINKKDTVNLSDEKIIKIDPEKGKEWEKELDGKIEFFEIIKDNIFIVVSDLAKNNTYLKIYSNKGSLIKNIKFHGDITFFKKIKDELIVSNNDKYISYSYKGKKIWEKIFESKLKDISKMGKKYLLIFNDNMKVGELKIK